MHTYRRIIRPSLVLAFFAALVVPAAAQAGSGASTTCATPLVTDVVTVAVDVTNDGIRLCYSTTEPGDDNVAIAGGAVEIDLDGPKPVSCKTDDNPTVVAVDCKQQGSVFEVTVHEQGQVIVIALGLHGPNPVMVACIRDVEVDGAFGTVGPIDVGLCP